MFKKLFLIVFFNIVFLGSMQARDQLYVVGSSTVYPFATVVAENFGQKSGMKVPKIESTGSGGGMKLFCAGIGMEHPDITNASRAIKSSEAEKCEKNGITPIERMIGYDGITFSNSNKAMQYKITKEDIFKAVSAKVMSNGKLVPNGYKKWNDINPPNINYCNLSDYCRCKY
mgnify:FL=1